MAKKPSQRTHRIKPMEGLNLTPFIDMITCLMFFLLMFAGVIPVVIIDAPLPKIASTAEEVKQAKDNKNNLEVTMYLKPDAIEVKTDSMGAKSFAKANNVFPWSDVHKFLVQLHGRKPDSHEITLMPTDDTPYEVMIDAMDTAPRSTRATPATRRFRPRSHRSRKACSSTVCFQTLASAACNAAVQ